MMTRKSLYCFVCWNLEKFQLCNLNVFSWEEEEKNSKNKQILFSHSYSSSSLVNSSYCFWCFFFFFLLLLLINHVNERTKSIRDSFSRRRNSQLVFVVVFFQTDIYVASTANESSYSFIWRRTHTHTHNSVRSSSNKNASFGFLLFLKYIFSCLFD